MVYVKVTNLFNGKMFGEVDYKGLDIQRIIPGTQLNMPEDDVICFEYDGEVPEHVDLQVLTEEEYEQQKQIFSQKLNEKVNHPLEQMQAQIDQLTLEILTLKGLV